MQAVTRADVRHEILCADESECLWCHWEDKLSKFWRWFTDRAGLTIVHCTCPMCSSGFRRIII